MQAAVVVVVLHRATVTAQQPPAAEACRGDVRHAQVQHLPGTCDWRCSVDQQRLWTAVSGLTWLLLPKGAAAYADRLPACAWDPGSHESILQAPSSFSRWLFADASPI